MESNSIDSKTVPQAATSIQMAATPDPEAIVGTCPSPVFVPVFIETLLIERIVPSVIMRLPIASSAHKCLRNSISQNLSNHRDTYWHTLKLDPQLYWRNT